MKIDGSVALVTGANRGLGEVYARELVAQVAAQCADVSLLVNNAGVLKYSTFTGTPNLDAARADERTRTVRAELSRDHELIHPPVQRFWDTAASGTG